MVLLTVFIVNNELRDGIIVGKYFWFYGSIIVVAFISPVIYFLNRNKIQITVIDCFVFMFAVSTLLSAIVVNGNFHTTKIVTFILLVTLYFFFRILFSQSAGSMQIILSVLVITALIESVLGLMQLYGFARSNHNLFKITGSFHNPGPYAGYLAVIFPVALERVMSYYKLRVKNEENTTRGKKLVTLGSYILSFSSAIAILLVLPANMSRAAWLALLFGSVAVIVLYSFRKIKIWMICVFLGILLSGFYGIYNLKKDSSDGRLLMWKISMQSALQNPAGIGLGHFPEAYGKSQAEYFSLNEVSEKEKYVAGAPEYAFNEYLQISIESGVISLFLYIALIIFAMLETLKNRQYGIFGAFISMSVFALFSYPFGMAPHLILLVFLLAATASNTNSYSKEKLCSLAFKGTAILSLTVITALCLINRYPVYKAYKDWSDNTSYGLYDDVNEKYYRLYPLLKDNINFLFEYAQYVAGHGKHEQSNTILQRAVQISCDPMLYNIMGKNHQALKEYRQAETCFTKAANIVPNRLYPFYLLTKLYHEMGLQEKVNEMADVVQTKEPKVHSRAIDEMRMEVITLRTNN
ncbi:MAG: O-antigen ligase family protein [Bacteroidales bacterium]|jgi:O-antigen ligase|nr:O-antigen ligase family protein [Bacteroidales bacterium]